MKYRHSISIIVSLAVVLTMLVSCGGRRQKAPQQHEAESSAVLDASTQAVEDAKNRTVLVRFIGDVMLHTGQIKAAMKPDSTFDFSPFLDEIAPDLREADIAVAGMEFTLGGKPYMGYPEFSAPDSYADYLIDCGVDVFLAANNHILDRGLPGIRRTMRTYDRLEKEGKVRYTGCSFPNDTIHNPLIMEAKGVKIAFINFTYNTNIRYKGEQYVMRQDSAMVMPLFEKAKQRGADVIIACPHWGEEYELKHSAEQEKWARMMAEAGADAIIGAHPHVVQDTTVITTTDGRAVPVYYSIGNAVSNMSAPNTQLELMVSVSISPEGKVLDAWHEWLWCSLPGHIIDSYTTVKVEKYKDRMEEWRDSTQYRKMVASLRDSL